MEKSQGRGIARGAPRLFLPLASVLLLICVSQARPAAAVQHQVGGTPGWSLPSRSNVNYTLWASKETFAVGDTLYFNYSSAFHNVVQVTEADYNNCSALSPIATWNDGATVVELNKTGTFYFLCSFPGHCDQGQKVAVLVQAASSSSSSTPSTPNAPNSAAAPPCASTLLHLCSLLAPSLIAILHLLP